MRTNLLRLVNNKCFQFVVNNYFKKVTIVTAIVSRLIINYIHNYETILYDYYESILFSI